MKILQIISTPLPAVEGIGMHASGLSNWLNDQGHDVMLATRKHRLQESTLGSGIETHGISAPRIFPMHAHIQSYYIKKFINKKGPYDIVHLHSPLVVPSRKIKGVLATFHTPMKADINAIPMGEKGLWLLKMQQPFSIWAEHALIAAATKVTAVSDTVREEIKEQYGCEASTIPNAIAAEGRFNTGAGRNPLHLLYVGRLAPRKGVARLIQLVKILRNAGLEVKLTIVGRGPLAGKLIQYSHQTGVADFVDFVGFVATSDLQKLYCSAGYFIHLPDYEGLPTTLLEAMRAGIPIVTWAAPGVVDFLKADGPCLAICAEYLNMDEIANELIDKISGGSNENLGAIARQTFLRNYTWDIVGPKYMSLMEGMLDDG